MSYSVLADVTAFLPSGGLPNPARVAYGSATGDYVESAAHGLSDDAEVTFRAETGGSVPTGLTAGATYYAIVSSVDRFQVAATAGGAAIALTSDGDNFVFSADLPWAQWIEWADRQIDSFLPAHVVPIVEPYPQIVVTASAELAAWFGLSRTAGAGIDLGAKLDAIGARLTRWAKTLPLRGTARSVTSPVNLAITASAGAVDPRGWASAGNTVLP